MASLGSKSYDLGSKSYDLGSTYGLRSDIDLDYRLRNATVGPMHITTTGASAADSTSRRLPKAVPGPLLVATAQHLRTAVAWPAACCAAVPTAQLNPIAAAAAPWGQPGPTGGFTVPVGGGQTGGGTIRRACIHACNGMREAESKPYPSQPCPPCYRLPIVRCFSCDRADPPHPLWSTRPAAIRLGNVCA